MTTGSGIRSRTAIISVSCAWCGLAFKAERRRVPRYCTDACRFAAYRQRRRDGIPARVSMARHPHPSQAQGF